MESGHWTVYETGRRMVQNTDLVETGSEGGKVAEVD